MCTGTHLHRVYKVGAKTEQTLHASFFLRKMLTQRVLFKTWNSRVKCGQYVVELWNTTNIGWAMGRDVVVKPPDV